MSFQLITLTRTSSFTNFKKAFDSCTQPLGALRQSLFSCLTCNPLPTNPDEPYIPAGVCYSCSISCHGEHRLVELFNKRDFVCDCGTTRLPSTSQCVLRVNPDTGAKGVSSEKPAVGNKYNQNFQNIFCGCEVDYDPHKEKGTMFQCLGLGSAEDGGCGEDWWHPECLMGLPRNWNETSKGPSHPEGDAEGKEAETAETVPEAEEDETPLPPGFPGEDDFESLICYKCLDAHPWLKRYAGATGFLQPVFKKDITNNQANEIPAEPQIAEVKAEDAPNGSKKRKADEDTEEQPGSKRPKELSTDNLDSIPEEKPEPVAPEKPKHESLPRTGPTGTFSLFLEEDFRDHLCRCASCFPNLAPHPQLREEEETYEPPLSEAGDDNAAGNGGGSQASGSLLDRGQAALSNMDRVRAIEGAMVYNHLRDKVKEFLTPFAETGQAVGADDIKSYFEKLRGDDQAIREAGVAQASASSNERGGDGGGGGGSGDKRHEQSGKLPRAPPGIQTSTAGR